MNCWWTHRLGGAALAIAGAGLPVPIARAAADQPAPAAPAPAGTATATAAASSGTVAQAQATLDKAFAYLKTQQKPDHSWQNPSDPPGITAIVLRAFLSDEKYDADQPFLEKGYDKLISYQLENGGIYKDALASYNTAIAVSALAVAREAEYQAPLDKALAYLKSLQWSDKIQGLPDDKQIKGGDKDPRYGGFGYGKRGRPDLSNTQMALDALHDAGLKPEDPAFQAALKFASRCQNLSETNDQPWAGDDGGFVYTDADGPEGRMGDSMAGEYTGPGGKRMLRSYGSMTYAGLKSMIYAGLGHDDPRVKAAWAWIRKNYSVDENPGLAANGPEGAKGGIYYYYHTMARALRAYGEPVVTDEQGTRHDWRAELIAKISTLQRDDGSFVGDRKWMEDNPVLVTSYVVGALEEAKKDLKEHPARQ